MLLNRACKGEESPPLPLDATASEKAFVPEGRRCRSSMRYLTSTNGLLPRHDIYNHLAGGLER